MSPAHVHLEYVGHGDVTDRLLEVDPRWTWEPMAVDERGYPLLTREGLLPDDQVGLWIRLTVLGVTRPGFGGGRNVKEAISDAIRNAAMRFGVALDMWRRELEVPGAEEPEEEAEEDMTWAEITASVRSLAVELPQAEELFTGYLRAAAERLWGATSSEDLAREQREALRQRAQAAVRRLRELADGRPSPDGITAEDMAAAWAAAMEGEVLEPIIKEVVP
ncbi:MAG: hypothetical protein QN122_12445 [Armatimonadota bacterium]|nr:hypothetical protein [Armatimonadota bacterium]